MVLISAGLFLIASVLPSVMGLTLDTPTAAQTNGAIDVTWTTVKTDPKFTLILQRQDAKEDIDVATGIDPTTLKTTVNLGAVPPGTYKLSAVQAADIAVPLSSTGAFQVTAAGAAAGGNNAAAGGAAATTAAGSTDASATCAPPVTVTVTAASGAATAAAATTAKKGKAGKKGKNRGRSLFSAKFGRRELYRE